MHVEHAAEANAVGALRFLAREIGVRSHDCSHLRRFFLYLLNMCRIPLAKGAIYLARGCTLDHVAAPRNGCGIVPRRDRGLGRRGRGRLGLGGGGLFAVALAVALGPVAARFAQGLVVLPSQRGHLLFHGPDLGLLRAVLGLLRPELVLQHPVLGLQRPILVLIRWDLGGVAHFRQLASITSLTLCLHVHMQRCVVHQWTILSLNLLDLTVIMGSGGRHHDKQGTHPRRGRAVSTRMHRGSGTGSGTSSKPWLLL